MEGNGLRTKLIHISRRHLGKWGDEFIVHQCERLGMDMNRLSRSDLEMLASEASKTAVIIVGKKRAAGLKREIEELAMQVGK